MILVSLKIALLSAILNPKGLSSDPQGFMVTEAAGQFSVLIFAAFTAVSSFCFPNTILY